MTNSFLSGTATAVTLVCAAVAIVAGIATETPGPGLEGTATARYGDGSSAVRVAWVVDGDTLRVETRSGRDLGRVRLLGIDAPETAREGEPADCYAASATRLLATLAPPGAIITLVADPDQPDRDVYGRLLRYVDHLGADVSETMLCCKRGPPVPDRSASDAHFSL